LKDGTVCLDVPLTGNKLKGKGAPLSR